MDGKGRAIDNIFIERFWRTTKYEQSAATVYLYQPIEMENTNSILELKNI